MGILINDEIETRYGLKLSNMYCSFGNSQIDIVQEISMGEKSIRITSTAYIWTDKDARDNNCRSISHQHVSISIDVKTIEETPLFKILYDNLKTYYMSTQDYI